jgi:DNA replication protein DnaC
LTTSETCPICNGSGWKAVKVAHKLHPERMVDASERCDCFWNKRKHLLRIAAAIPTQYRACTFDTFTLDGRSVSVQQASVQAKALAIEYPAVKCRLLFTGPCGVGKTHLGVAILDAMLHKGIRCRFRVYGELLTEIRSTYHKDSDTGHESEDPIARSPEGSLLVPLKQIGGGVFVNGNRLLGYLGLASPNVLVHN